MHSLMHKLTKSLVEALSKNFCRVCDGHMNCVQLDMINIGSCKASFLLDNGEQG